MYISKTGQGKYYFDRNIDGIILEKDYYIEVNGKKAKNAVITKNNIEEFEIRYDFAENAKKEYFKVNEKE